MGVGSGDEAFCRWLVAMRDALAGPERVVAWQDRRYQFAHQVGQLLTGPAGSGAPPVSGHVVYGVRVPGAGLLYVGQTGDARRRLRDLPVGESHHLATTVPPETWDRVIVIQWPSLLPDAPEPERLAAAELGHETVSLALEYLLQVTCRPVLNARRRSGAGEWTARNIDRSRSRGALSAHQFPRLFQAVSTEWDQLARTPVPRDGNAAVFTGAGRIIFPGLLL
jgi:hypothetical protein